MSLVVLFTPKRLRNRCLQVTRTIPTSVSLSVIFKDILRDGCRLLSGFYFYRKSMSTKTVKIKNFQLLYVQYVQFCCCCDRIFDLSDHIFVITGDKSIDFQFFLPSFRPLSFLINGHTLLVCWKPLICQKSLPHRDVGTKNETNHGTISGFVHHKRLLSRTRRRWMKIDY